MYTCRSTVVRCVVGTAAALALGPVVANAEDVALHITYQGPFVITDDSNPMAVKFRADNHHAVGSSGDLQLNESAQSWDVDALVTPNRIYNGFATFSGPFGTLFSTFEGVSPVPPPGQPYVEAFVDVTFTGGTGVFVGATGHGTVYAQLAFTGISTGTIDGIVTLVPAPGPLAVFAGGMLIARRRRR